MVITNAGLARDDARTLGVDVGEDGVWFGDLGVGVGRSMVSPFVDDSTRRVISTPTRIALSNR